MVEFEPKKKKKIFTKQFMAKYAYVFVLGVILLLGVSYSITFFIQNRKIASGSITTAGLEVTYTDRSINASNLTAPSSNQDGLSEYSKSITLTNTTAYDGVVTMKLTRTSGLNLTDLSYALIINGAIQEIDDVPSDGVILTTAILGNEVINAEVKLWPKTSYSGNVTTFVGTLDFELKFLGEKASNRNDLANTYVSFNCDGNNCETWRIVKVESGRLVLTREADLTGAGERTDSGKYNSALSFDDDSMITSVSTDNKNVYLAKTVKISGGAGTQASPYTLVNDVEREPDKKIVAVITYKDDNDTTVGTQFVYYGQTNYVSQVMNDEGFQYWSDGTNTYILGDTIAFTSDTDLEGIVVKSYYRTLKSEAILDDERSTYVNSDSGINFGAASSDDNGKGLYMRATTKNDVYPILYYRGAVTNNNVLFAGFCWKIVRTTETGGIKMIYNGIAENDQCLTSRTAPSGVKTGVSRSIQILNDQNGTYNYYYGTNYTYDTTTNKFKLAGTVSNSKQWNATNSSDLISKYTCKATTADAECTPLYFIDNDYSWDSLRASTTQLTITSTGHFSQLGQSVFNAEINSVADSGYMYNKVYYNTSNLSLSTSNNFVTNETILQYQTSFSASYYYASSFDWNTTNANKYTLTSPTQITSGMDYSTLVNKYVMPGTNNSTMYYVVKYVNNKLYYITFNSNGTHDLAYFNNSYTYGDTLTDNQDGTYTVSNSNGSNITTIYKSTYYDNYTNIAGKYFCKDDTSGTCANPYYMVSTTNTVIAYVSASNTITIAKTRSGLELTGTPITVRHDLLIKNQSNYSDYKYTCGNNNTTCTAANLKYIIDYATNGNIFVTNHYFGTSVEKVGNNYVLQNTIDLENYNNLASLATHHYTCVTAGLTECDKVAYIYYHAGGVTAKYILLENNTMSVADAIEEMQTNTKDSTIKGIIDNWYYNNLNTNFGSYLEDTKYCNDRSMNTAGSNQSYINNSWIANGGEMNNNLYYSGYGRAKITYTPSFNCQKNDAFTVNETNDGNGELTYPIGLLTSDEIMLAGGKYSANSYYLHTGKNYWLMSPSIFKSNSDFADEFSVSTNGDLGDGSVNNSMGVRPVISLKPGTMLGDGTGEYDQPLKIVE